MATRSMSLSGWARPWATEPNSSTLDAPASASSRPARRASSTVGAVRASVSITVNATGPQNAEPAGAGRVAGGYGFADALRCKGSLLCQALAASACGLTPAPAWNESGAPASG